MITPSFPPHTLNTAMTGLFKVLALLGALSSSAAFCPPHHGVARSWSIRSPMPRFGSRLSFTRSNHRHVLGNFNSTVHDDYTNSDNVSKEFYEHQAMTELQQLQKLEQLVQQKDEIINVHTEQESTATLVTSIARASDVDTTEQDEGGFLDVVWKARLLLLGAAALYGTNFSVIKILGDTMPVGISSTLRFGLAALATLPWLLAPPKDGSTVVPSSTFQKNWWETPWETLQSATSSTTVGAALAGFEVGMWNSVGYLAQAVGLETTDASKSAFICSLAVCIVPLIDYCSGKKLLPRQVTGAAMAVAGVGFLEFGGGASLSLSSGDLASLLQPLAFGVAFWRMETAMRRYPQEANRSTAGQLLAVFITSLIYCLSTCTIDLPQIQGWLADPTILGALFFTGIITTALSLYMEAVALKTLSAAETTLILSTEPLWGAAFASFLIGEQFGMDAATGAALIIAGCIFSNLGWDGMLEMVGRKKKAIEEIPETLEEEQPLNIEAAEKVILEVGMIGMLARLVALLEMGDFAIGVASAASVVAVEEVVEEVVTHVGDLPL